jgi:hypothetical protein
MRARIELVYHRQMRIDDPKPCGINVFCGHYYELAPPPPRLLADWTRYVVEDLRLRKGSEYTYIIPNAAAASPPSLLVACNSAL